MAETFERMIMADTEKVASNPSLDVHESLIPKEGKQTSSFFVLLATIVVGAIFTGVFAWVNSKGYLTSEQAGTFRNQLVSLIADALPYVYLAVVGFLTKAYIKVRGEVSIAKTQALGAIITAEQNRTGPDAPKNQ